MSTAMDLDIATEFAAMLGVEDPWQLILWNDDVNTFDHVVATLTRVLQIPVGRAEHLAQEAHLQGRSIACDGEQDKMQSLAQALGDNGITASVEKPA
jgi:ATP-dependent Clp protease adaptor protein ClpS